MKLEPLINKDFEDFEGHNKATSDAFEEWAEKHVFMCHMTVMGIDEGYFGETVFVCNHCGHTVDEDGMKVEV